MNPLSKTICISTFFSIGRLIILCWILAHVALTQIKTTVIEKSIPRTEEFVASDDLVMPSRSFWLTCARSFVPNPLPNCPSRGSYDKWKSSHTLPLYNDDGRVWYQFSVEPQNAAYYLNSNTNVLKPLGPEPYPLSDGINSHPDFVVLRILRESQNWYEVEANKETGSTKYVDKSDPLWARTNWFGIFNMSYNVVIDQSKTKLLDSPNGKPSEACGDSKFDRLNFRKLEGDWMFVLQETHLRSKGALDGFVGAMAAIS